MKLTREKGLRMWGGGGTGGSGGGGGLDPSALAGYASMGWVEDNYVSKAFFNQLFELQYNHRVLTKNGETVVSDVTTAMVAAPNEVVDLVSHTETDEETGYTIITTNTITGIKAKAGLWTNQYLSALGQNAGCGGGGGATLFEPLLSINESGLAAPTDAQDGMTVVWDKNTHKWKYGATGGGNADRLDGWHLDNIVNTGYISSSVANLQSYWCKIWDVTVTDKQYNDLDITFLAASAFNSIEGIIHLKIRQNGANNSGNYSFSKFVRLVAGYIPLERVKLYCDNTTGKCELWMNVNGQYGVFNVSILKKSFRVGQDEASIGTLYSTFFTEEQTPPALSEAEIVGMTAYDLVGNAESATKLATARTLWGQSFDGTANVSGNMTGVGNISANGNYISSAAVSTDIQVSVGNNNGTIALLTSTNRGIYDNSTNRWLLATNGTNTWLTGGNVGIGISAPAYKLDVDGTINCTSIRIGGYLITADSVNGGLHLNNGGFWADTFISALGLNSSGGGGGGSSTLAGLLDVNIPNPMTQANDGQVLMYNSSLTKWVNGEAGMNETQLTNYLNSKVLTVKNGQTTLGTWNPTAAGTIDIASALTGFLKHEEVGTSDLTGYAGSFFFGGGGTLQSNYDYVGFQAGNSLDKWQMVAIDSLKWRQNDSGGTNSTNWTAWKTILDSNNSGIVDGHKVNLNSISIEVPVAYSIPSNGSFTSGYWHKLGEYVTAGDSSNLVLEIYDGNGYNAQAEQNSILRVVIKDGWQSTRAAANSVGVTIERFGVWAADMQISIVATDHNAGAVWIYFPWQYAAGTYMVSGNYSTWTHNSGTTGDTTTTPATNQTKSTGGTHSYVYLDNAYTNSNVASATKLQTARLLWGNSFDGTADVNGDITITKTGTTPALMTVTNGTGTIRLAAYETNRGIWDASGSGWLIGTGPTSSNPNTFLMRGNVGIGKSSPSYKLDVDGTINCTSIRIGGYTITADTTNQGLRINSAGLYADTYISALGANSGGGGGGGVTLNEPLSSINNASLGSPSGTDMAIVWTGSAWGYKYVPDNGGGGGGSGTVTSIKITVPTGFSISPTSAITTSGTFSITFASGYSLPTTAKQSNWDTAYNNNHQHSNKSVLDGITSTKVSNWDTAYDDHHTHANMSFLNSLTSISGTFWGKSWSNGGAVSGNISAGSGGGSIEDFHSIELNSAGSLSGYGGFIDFHYNGSSSDFTSRIIEDASGRLYLNASNGVRIGNGVLKWDSTNNAFKIEKFDGTAANLYATGGVSALGMSAGVTSIDAMTFGYLTVNNELNFGSSAKMYMDDFFYIESSETISINSVEFDYEGNVYTNGNVRASRFYLDSNRYLYVSSGKLYYYNGSTAKQVAFTN